MSTDAIILSLFSRQVMVSRHVLLDLFQGLSDKAAEYLVQLTLRFIYPVAVNLDIRSISNHPIMTRTGVWRSSNRHIRLSTNRKLINLSQLFQPRIKKEIRISLIY